MTVRPSLYEVISLRIREEISLSSVTKTGSINTLIPLAVFDGRTIKTRSNDQH
uniref:Uncharacterized protein n=1 Tax=Klebsiella pneumoniae TaxID=573 RepID=A0A8B0SV44_KLEPN|nr:hypothetical protein [Klebsiella pneumoniae]